MSAVQNGDCTIIEHFLDQGIDLNGPRDSIRNDGNDTSYFTFGYVYVKQFHAYYCTTYSAGTFAGTKIGETNTDEGKRVICSCGQGNKLCASHYIIDIVKQK